jgi:signal transduction histidine kinase
VESATRSPSADLAGDRPIRQRLRAIAVRLLPRTLQARLTLAFVGVTALTLALVSVVVLNRLDDYFRGQVQADLGARAVIVRDLTSSYIAAAIRQSDATQPVVARDGSLNPAVAGALSDQGILSILARVGQANLDITIGSVRVDVVSGQATLVPSHGGSFRGLLQEEPESGQAARDPSIGFAAVYPISAASSYGLGIALSDPFTFRASTLRTITSLLVIVALIALAASVVVAAFVARRFTSPLVRLTEASRALAEGDLSRRVPVERAILTSSEIAELSRQFNTMADRLEESLAIIRRDRDRSRDFLADVSHELRTPIAAMRTFVELLQGEAGRDPAARKEFVESSAQQLERLDWLAQNLLELSKLDSGLVLLDLRPEDLRAAVQSAVEQAGPTAQRRGVFLRVRLPDEPLRIRHDPQRIGQVVSNLIGNALKFTPQGGAVDVELTGRPEGAQIEVRDTGVGIDATELPRIFERFYRGSQAHEARSSGSGLGLAIVKSIVDMHGGRIEVESRVGNGTRVRVVLPTDPRLSGALDEDEPAGVTPLSGELPEVEAVPIEPVTASARGRAPLRSRILHRLNVRL